MTEQTSTVQGQTEGVGGGQPVAPAVAADNTAQTQAAMPAAEQVKTGADANAAAPAEYADFGLPELPEGMEYDQAMLDSFKAEAKQLGLSQEGAAKFANMYAGKMVEMHKAAIEQQQQQVTQWAKDCEADPEISGAGGRDFKANVDLAQATAARIATPEFMDLMRRTGLGNHPEMVRMFINIGKTIMPDNTVAQSGGSQSADPAKVLYPNM